MDLNLLEVFVAVAEHHSFTRAADELGIQRSAASRRVAALEQELGVQLLIRSTRHVEVTTAGRRLLRDVSPLLTRLEAAIHELPEASLEPAGELKITAPADLGHWLLPPVLGALTARYPDLLPVVHLSNRVVDLEREGYDVALRITMKGLPDSSLRARKLGDVVTRLYAAPAYLDARGTPETAEDLDRHALVGLSALSGLARRDGPTVVADDMVFASELAKHGVGVAWLPDFLAVPAVERGELVPILPEVTVATGQLYAMFPSARELPPKITAFRDALVARLETHPLPGRVLAPPTAAT